MRGGALALLVRVALVAPLSLLGRAEAAQFIDIRDGDTAVVRLSVRDQTRLRVAEGRVLDLVGDIFEATSNPSGRLAVLKDVGAGEVYLKSVGSAAGGPAMPLKLDVKTDRGTVGLLLQPADIVGETITLRVTGGSVPAPDDGAASAPAYVRRLKALMLAMAQAARTSTATQTGLVTEWLSGEPDRPLWREARLTLEARSRIPGFDGEHYLLTNVSRNLLVVDERELYRDGVAAISVERLTLSPGESTWVWIARQRGPQGWRGDEQR